MGTEPFLSRRAGAVTSDADPFHLSNRQAGHASHGENSPEESRLDEAMRRADDLLIGSLRDEEHRRRGRRLRAVLLASAAVGGLIMIVTIIALLTGLLGNADADKKNSGPLAAIKAEDRAAAYAQEGWALWQRGQAQEAQSKFISALELDPKNASTWNGLGWSYIRNGQAPEAQEAFAKAVELEEAHPAALNGLGNAAFMQKDYAAAEKHWLKAADTAPASWFGLAKLYLLQGKFEESAKWANKAATESPDDEGLKRIIAAAEAKKVDPALRRELEPQPAATGGAAQGWILAQQGKTRQAIEAFQAAIKKNPDDTAALNGLGFALLNSGKPAEAKPHFEKCLKLDPEAAGAMNGLARCLKAEDKPEEAIKVWEQMAEKTPGVTAATHGLAQTHLELRQYDKAIPYLEQLTKANPTDEEARRKLASARAGAGK